MPRFCLVLDVNGLKINVLFTSKFVFYMYLSMVPLHVPFSRLGFKYGQSCKAGAVKFLVCCLT